LGVGARCPEFPRAPSPGPRASLRSFASRFRRAPPACPRTIQLVASLLRRIVRPGSDSGTLSPGARGRHQASGIRRPVLSNSTASLHGGAFYWVWGRVVLSFPERLRRAARVASLLCVPAQARPARLPTNDPACRFAPAPDRSPRIVRPRPAAELTVNPDDRGV